MKIEASVVAFNSMARGGKLLPDVVRDDKTVGRSVAASLTSC